MPPLVLTLPNLAHSETPSQTRKANKKYCALKSQTTGNQPLKPGTDPVQRRYKVGYTNETRYAPFRGLFRANAVARKFHPPERQGAIYFFDGRHSNGPKGRDNSAQGDSPGFQMAKRPAA